MKVSVVVPYRGDGERARTWRWLRPLYAGWEVVEADSDGAWCKGQAVNRAAAQSSGDMLVIADADVLVPRDTLDLACLLAVDGPWVVPHGWVYRWSRLRSQRVMVGADQNPLVGPFARERKPGPAGGGVVVVSRDGFDRVGGMDERFVGWGGEDISFGWALDTLVGKHRRLGVPMAHLFHRPLPMRPGRRACEESERLAGAYRDARGDIAAMEALCRQRS